MKYLTTLASLTLAGIVVSMFGVSQAMADEPCSSTVVTPGSIHRDPNVSILNIGAPGDQLVGITFFDEDGCTTSSSPVSQIVGLGPGDVCILGESSGAKIAASGSTVYLPLSGPGVNVEVTAGDQAVEIIFPDVSLPPHTVQPGTTSKWYHSASYISEESSSFASAADFCYWAMQETITTPGRSFTSPTSGATASLFAGGGSAGIQVWGEICPPEGLTSIKFLVTGGASAFVTELSAPDSVVVDGGSHANIDTDGAYIYVDSGSSATVTNTGSTALAVHMYPEAVASVPPGSTVTVTAP